MWDKFLEYTTEVIVCFSFAICLIFTVAVMVLSVYGVDTNETLVEWVFKFFGLELVALSGIKISKHVGSAFGKHEEMLDGYCDEEDEEDEEDDDEE